MTFLLFLVSRLVRAYRLPFPPPRHAVRRVLVVDANFLGDMLLSSPVYRALKEHFPEARIEAMVYAVAAPALKANPWVDGIHQIRQQNFVSLAAAAFTMRRLKFDLVLQLNTSLKTNILLRLMGARYRLGYDYRHRACVNNLRVPLPTRTAKTGYRTDECIDLLEKAFGWTVPDRELIFVLGDKDESRVQTTLSEEGIGSEHLLIGIHAHCRQGKELREWGHSRFTGLADALIERHHAHVVLTGSKDDIPDVDALAGSIHDRLHVHTMAGKLSLGELGALLRRLAVFITVNTGPMHMAVALRVPTVAIIGGTPPGVVFPRNDPRFRYVVDPALESWDPAVTRYRYRPSLHSIAVGDVLEQVEFLLRTQNVLRSPDPAAVQR